MMLDSKLLIMFLQGSSGNFLANWLTEDTSILDHDNVYWIDKPRISKNHHRVFLGFPDDLDQRFMGLAGMINDMRSIMDHKPYRDFFDGCVSSSINDNVKIVISHIFDHEELEKILPYTVVKISIWPINNKFGFYKSALSKMHNSFLDDYATKGISRFEHLYNTIGMYHSYFKDHMINHNHLIIDYSQLLDIDYLCNLHVELLGSKPSDAKIEWANRYITMQPKIITCHDQSDYDILRKSLCPKDFLDVVILLYIYETNNPNLRRCWTIDDIPHDPIQALSFIDANHKNYY